MDESSKETIQDHVFTPKSEESVPNLPVVETEKQPPLPSNESDGKEETTMNRNSNDAIQDHVYVPKVEESIPKLVESEKLPPSCEVDFQEDITVDSSSIDTTRSPDYAFVSKPDASKPDKTLPNLPEVESEKLPAVDGDGDGDNCYHDVGSKQQSNRRQSREKLDAQILWLIDNIVFVVASAIYVAMEVTVLLHRIFTFTKRWSTSSVDKKDTTMESNNNDTVADDDDVVLVVAKSEEGPPDQIEECIESTPPPSLEDDSDDCFHENDDDDDDDSKEKNTTTKAPDIFDVQLRVVSTIVFAISSAIYVAMEVTVLPYYRFYEGTPWHVRESDDDEVWWKYYNETDAVPEYLRNSTDENARMKWYNNSFLNEEEELGEFLFQVPNAGSKYENVEEENAAWVSQFMMLYFCAALGFLVTGILELYRATRFWSMILYSVMILAAAIGMMSAMLVNKDARFSTILNTVSVHLFAVEAIFLIISRWQHLRKIQHDATAKSHSQNHDDDLNGLDTCLTIPAVFWLFLGDICFLIGTTGDVVLSYFYILEQDFIEHAVAAIATSALWLLSALLYLAVHSLKLIKVKKYFEENGLNEKSSDVRKLQSIVILLVVLAALVVALGIAFGLDLSSNESSSVESEESTFPPTDVSTSDGTVVVGGNETGNFTDDIILLMENCTKSMSMFSDTTVVLTMSVMSTVTAIEIQYAANVFLLTYQGMLRYGFGDAEAIYCDPFCRDITDVIVMETRTANTTTQETISQQSNTQCDTELQLTFSVDGTYWACENMPFPGLFSEDGTNGKAVEPGIRWLVEEPACPVCPDDPNSQGLMVPSESSLLEAMTPFMTVLPAVCELLSIDTLDTGI